MKKEPMQSIAQDFTASLFLIYNNFFRREAVPIPLNQFAILMKLRGVESLTLTELGAILKISKQQMTALIGKLFRSGFIEKIPSVEDRRSTHIRLTASGEIFLKEHDVRLEEDFNSRLPNLNEKERLELQKTLQTFNRYLKKMK